MVLGTSQKQGLKRTTAEKEFLRSISALEESYFLETDPERKAALLSQLNELRGGLSGVSSSTYGSIRLDSARLKAKNGASRQDPSEAQKEGQTTLPEAESPLQRLYRLILSRHAALLNEREEKTVGEIKALITKDDLTIQSMAEKFRQEGYNFGNHYFQAAEKAYNYVKDEIARVDGDLGVSFWLTPTEIVSEKIGDDEDQAVFLCSLLYALGDDAAECLIAELENASTHAFVATEFKGNFLLLDPMQGAPFREFYGQKKEVLEKYSYNGSRIRRFVYRFNRGNYEQFQG